MEHFYQKIEGWFDYQRLYTDMVAIAKDGALFVELGCYKGCSSAFMGVEIANSGKSIAMICIDNWNGNEVSDKDCVINKTMQSEFIDNTAPVSKYIRCMTGDSANSSVLFDDESVDFVFIDADHSYDGVKRDILAWYPKVKIGGFIAGHDYEIGRGVVPAVNELFNTDFYLNRVTWVHLKKHATI